MPKWYIKCTKSQLKKLKIVPEAVITEASSEVSSSSAETTNEVSNLNQKVRVKLKWAG